jgi:hypothetical protein
MCSAGMKQVIIRGEGEETCGDEVDTATHPSIGKRGKTQNARDPEQAHDRHDEENPSCYDRYVQKVVVQP